MTPPKIDDHTRLLSRIADALERIAAALEAAPAHPAAEITPRAQKLLEALEVAREQGRRLARETLERED